MPTGYTAIIEDGDGCTFEQYLWRCVRAMGATIMMRDDSLDVPVTDERIAGMSTYYQDELKKEHAKLAELLLTTPEQADALMEAEYLAARKQREQSIDRSAEVARRYSAMRRAAQAWEPPTPKHEGLREFMLQQIAESTKYGPYSPPEPVRQTGKEWLAEQIGYLQQRIQRHEKDARDEQERTRECIAWVQAVRDVVPQPDPPPRQRRRDRRHRRKP